MGKQRGVEPTKALVGGLEIENSLFQVGYSIVSDGLDLLDIEDLLV